MIKKIGVLTSGGDAPGMNAAIRGVVRAALTEGLEVFGIYDGYLGLYEDRMVQLDRYSVSDMINRGGTFLGSARFPEFRDEHIREVAIENMKKRGLDALVVIGGDGSYMGAKRLTEMGFPCIGLPGTIDNDIKGTDYTIGYFTALGTVVEAIDRLRDTSSSHQRISIVEVMGRYCGDLTLAAAIAGGCEFVVVPEVEFSREVHRNRNQTRNPRDRSGSHSAWWFPRPVRPYPGVPHGRVRDRATASGPRRPLRRYSERETGSPRHHRRH